MENDYNLSLFDNGTDNWEGITLTQTAQAIKWRYKTWWMHSKIILKQASGKRRMRTGAGGEKDTP